MEKPVMPNPETMTEAEFDKWLEDEYIWEAEQIEKTLFPDGIPEDTSTPEEKEAVAEIRCHSQRKGNLARRLIFKTCRNAGLFLFRKIQHINSKAKQNRGFPGC